MDPPNFVRKQMTLSRGHTATIGSASMSKEDKEHLCEIAFEAVKTACAEKIPILGQVELKSLRWSHDSDSDSELVLKSDNETDGSGRDLADTCEGSIVEADAGLSASAPDAGTVQASLIDTDQMSVIETDQMSVMEEDQMSVFEAEHTSVVDEGTESSGGDVKLELEDHASHEGARELNIPCPLTQLINELKIKASIVRANTIAVWKRQMRGRVLRLRPDTDKVWVSALSEEGEPVMTMQKPKCRSEKKTNCPFEYCDSLIFDHHQSLRRHLLTHYPYAMFCPICCRSFAREDSLGRHFSTRTTNSCLLTVKAQRFPIIHYPDGRLAIDMSYNYFNIYYLGAMEDDVMPDSHFELIARRKRHAPIRES